MMRWSYRFSRRISACARRCATMTAGWPISCGTRFLALLGSYAAFRIYAVRAMPT